MQQMFKPVIGQWGHAGYIAGISLTRISSLSISFHLFNINYKNSNMAFHGTCQPLNNSGVANRGHDLA